MPKITKTVIDAALPQDREFTVWDSELKGFGVRVRPSGARSYVVIYRPAGEGRRAAVRRVTIDAIGKITPDQARTVAKRILGSIAHGDDPAGERAHERRAATLKELAETFLSEHVEAKRKPATAAKYRYVVEAFIIPAFGRLKPSDITRGAVARVHHENAERPTIANYIVAVLSAIFTFGESRGLIPDGTNPTRHVERFEEEKRERFLTVAELARLGEALREAETTGLPWRGQIATGPKAKHIAKPENRVSRFDPAAVAAVRLLMFTGCRLREILHLKWSEVDFERGLLFLGDSKTGKKSIVLNAPALAILQGLPDRGAYVIPGDLPDAPRSDLKRLWSAVTARADLAGVRIHDLRHTFASYGAGGGLGLPIVGKLLGHAQASSTFRYSHLDSDPLRRAADTIGATIAAAMEGGRGGEVVAIAKTKRRSHGE
jgi:integrase